MPEKKGAKDSKLGKVPLGMAGKIATAIIDQLANIAPGLGPVKAVAEALLDQIKAALLGALQVMVDKLGEAVIKAVAELREKVSKRIETMNQRLDCAEKQARDFREYAKERFDGVDGQIVDLRGYTSERFDGVDSQFASLKESVERLQSSVNESNVEVNRTNAKVLWSFVAMAAAGLLTWIAKSIVDMAQ